MDMKHGRRTNTAYIRTVDLQLNGNQINLAERPSPRDQLTYRRKVARSLRPCTLRRPLSATPSLGYRSMNRSKKMPPWSRPQSAGGSSSLRRSKLAAKFSDSTLNDPDYCPDFGATYTLSSSQLLHSLMGSCSINEGLDSDSTPAPSPQPSLGDTIKAAAQLEPGLTAKPPLPPTPTPQPRAETIISDDIIEMKFKKWFPDAILESEVIKRASLSVNPFEKHKDDTDHSDAGTSVTDGAELSDRDNVEMPLYSGNISTFVKKLRIPKIHDEGAKKSVVKFSNNVLGNNDESPKDSPMIVVHEPDIYGCDLVTEEFTSGTNIHCMTPDHATTLKKSNHFPSKVKSCKRLSLSDLSDVKSTSNPDIRSHTINVYSDSELYKDSEPVANSSHSEKPETVYSDSELYKSKEHNIKISTKCNHPRNEVASPANFETSASKLRFTSTPIGVEINEHSSNDNFKNQIEVSPSNSDRVLDKDIHKSKHKDNHIESKNEEYKSFNNQSPPTRLKSEEKQFDYLNSHEYLMKDNASQNFIRDDPNNMNDKDQQLEFQNNNNTKNQKDQEKHAHFIHEVKPICQSTGTDLPSVRAGYSVNNSSESRESNTRPDRNKHSIDEKGYYDYLRKRDSKHENEENTGKGFTQKNIKPKEMCRAASVPPYPTSKFPVPLSKQNQFKLRQSHTQNTKRKFRRSMSHDTMSGLDMSEKDSGVSSYEDIVTMIKVLEKEDLESPVLNYKASTPTDGLVTEQSPSAKEILNFLDEVERGTMAMVETDRSLTLPTDDNTVGTKDPPVSSRLGSLLNTDTADLAQQVMTLTLHLEESKAVCKALEERYKQSVELLKQQKNEGDETDRRHQKFIDQLLKEKRQLAVQYETAIRELEAKHETAIKVVEERHKVEMKKAQDKFNAAEKIRRDKWIDAKTKKIKELTVRGLEPELERMAAAHQEELGELRRVHQRQLTELEGVWSRRMEALREQESSERQTAVQHEREAARHRLEQEMCQVEKSYQEQRRRLLEEVRQEKDLLHRQNERVLAEKQNEIARQVDEAKRKLQIKFVDYDKQHGEEIAKLKECLETEKQAWITRQKGALEEKEAALREELKRERDRHIELVIRRLESEAAAKEQAIENKIKRLKESYDAEVNDLDATLKDLRARLKDARTDLQKSEDKNAALTAQLSQAQNEVLPLKQTVQKLQKDYNELMQQSDSKMDDMQREINEIKQSFQEQVNKVHNDKEKQLQQVYTRVKEAISKKEEAVLLITKQRDAALEQCSRLEKMLENQRNNSLKL